MVSIEGSGFLRNATHHLLPANDLIRELLVAGISKASRDLVRSVANRITDNALRKSGGSLPLVFGHFDRITVDCLEILLLSYFFGLIDVIRGRYDEVLVLSLVHGHYVVGIRINPGVSRIAHVTLHKPTREVGLLLNEVTLLLLETHLLCLSMLLQGLVQVAEALFDDALVSRDVAFGNVSPSLQARMELGRYAS